MIDKGHDRFAAGVAAWRAGLGKVRDAVRRELVARQLAGYLPPPTSTAARWHQQTTRTAGPK
ncbi:MAG: hypothetical protein ACYDGN_15900 [Acidimicrobiales bacterium]